MVNSDLTDLAGIGQANQEDEQDSEICEFEIVPQEWKKKYGIQPSGGNYYECDQKKLDGISSDVCKYHANKKELENSDLDEDEDEVFYSLLQRNDNESSIVGAKFTDVSVHRKDIGSSGSPNIRLLSPRINSLSIDGCNIDSSIFFISSIIGDIKITKTNINRRVLFKHGRFDNRVRISKSKLSFEINFKQGTYNCPLTFDRVRFDDDFLISESKIRSDILCIKCEFNAKLNLDRPKTSNVVFIQNSHIDDFDCNIQSDYSAMVCLPRTNIRTGELRQPEETIPYDLGQKRAEEDFQYDDKTVYPRKLRWIFDEYYPRDEVLYDLREAELGNVTLRPNVNKLDNYYFYNTKMKRFDFIRHRGHLEDSGWNLHSLNRRFIQYSGHNLSGSQSIRDLKTSVDKFPYPPQIRDHQETYIPATQSASEQGDNRAASIFFIRESKARKMMRRRQILFPNPRRKTSRIGYLFRYIGSRLWQSLCNFGESSRKIAMWSLLIIFGCASLYPVFGTTNQSDNTISWFVGEPMLPTALESIYLSAATFVSLGYGSVTLEGTLPRLLAAGEALAGAFLIALYVFTLGRSIRR